MESVNPFLDNIENYKDINQRISDYQNQIETIKRDLERKTKILVESQANYKKAMEKKAKELIESCTHLNSDGQTAIDKTHTDILIQVDNKLIKHSYCSLCGQKFKTGETELEPIKKQAIINNTIDYVFDDHGEFVDTMDFDPNFDTFKFLDDTQGYYNRSRGKSFR